MTLSQCSLSHSAVYRTVTGRLSRAVTVTGRLSRAVTIIQVRCHPTSSYVEDDPGEFFKNQSHSGAVDWKIGWGYKVGHGGAACNAVWPTVHESDRGMYPRMVANFDHFRCFLAIFTSNVALENALEPASQWRCGLVNWLGIQCRPWRCCTQRGLAYSSRV